jgi:hypothetical protein
MPSVPEPRTGLVGSLILGGFALALAAAVLFTWTGRVVIALVLVVSVVLDRAHHRKLQRLASERRGEDIGTFARAFDRRREPFDPWVVRAVWDAMWPYVTVGGGRVPMRATDHIDNDLSIDREDLDMGLIQEISHRTGRVLDNIEANPLCCRVDTVGDLVRLLSSQPLSPAGEALRSD